jgi:hypothetical protein
MRVYTFKTKLRHVLVVFMPKYGLLESVSGDNLRHCLANLCCTMCLSENLSKRARKAIRKIIKRELNL